MKPLDTRLLRMMKNYRGQIISAGMIIALGLSMYVGFSFVFKDMGYSLDNYYQITRFADLTLSMVKAPQSVEIVTAGSPFVAAAQGRISVEARLKTQDIHEKVTIRLVSIQNAPEPINDLYMLGGRKPERGSREVVLLEQFAQERGILIGDTMTVNAGGRLTALKVTGLCASPEYVYLLENASQMINRAGTFGIVYLDQDFAQSLLGYPNSCNELVIRLKPGADADEAVKDLERRLKRYGLKQTVKRKDQASHMMIQNEINQLKIMSRSIPLVFLSMAAVIIAVFIARIVKNDRHAIGILMAIGYDKSQILGHYIKFCLFTGMIGALAGNLLGIPLAWAMTRLYAVYFHIPVLITRFYGDYLFFAAFLSAVFCGGAGALSAKNILKVAPADAMKPLSPAVSPKAVSKPRHAFFNALPVRWKLVLRNISRKKRRFALMALCVAVTYGILVMPDYMVRLFLTMFDDQYGHIYQMDYNIDFVRPQNEHVLNDIRKLIDVTHIEPRLEYPFELRNGWKTKTVSLLGIPGDTHFYALTDLKERPAPIPEDGILLSKNLADALDAQPGDRILLRHFLPGRADIPLEVKGIVSQYLGINGYMNIRAMQRQLLDQAMITGVSVHSRDAVVAKLKDVKGISAVNSIADLKQALLDYMDVMNASVYIFLVFGGLIGFAVIYNSVTINLSERQMELSSLRVLGFQKQDLFSVITRENALMTLCAIGAGIPLGAAMCYIVTDAMTLDAFSMPMRFFPFSYVEAAAATLIFSALAQLAVRRKLYALDFIEALKNRSI